MGFLKKAFGGGGGWNPFNAAKKAAEQAFNVASRGGKLITTDSAGKLIETAAKPISGVTPVTLPLTITQAVNKIGNDQGGLERTASPFSVKVSSKGVTVSGGGGGGVVDQVIGGAGSAVGAVVDAGGKVVEGAKDIGGKVVEGAKDVGKATEKGFKDTVNETERLGERVKKPIQELGRQGTEAYNIYKTAADASIQNRINALRALAKGDFKGLAKAGLSEIEGGKKLALDSTKYWGSKVIDPYREVGKATGFKDLEETAKNVNREGRKAVDIYGPLAIDMGLDYYTGGMYSAGKAALQGMAEGGLKGAVNRKTLEEAAIQALAAKYGGTYKLAKPEYLRALNEASKGDLEKAVYAGIRVDPESAKAIRQAVTEGKDVKDSLQEIFTKYLDSKYKMGDEDLVKNLLSGKISKSMTSLAKNELEKKIPGFDKELLGSANNYLEKAKSLKDAKKLASNAAGEYFGINPTTLQMASKIIKDPESVATEAISSRYGIDPSQYNNIPNMLSKDLKATALQGIASNLGVHPQDIQLMQNLVGEDPRGVALRALSENIGISPEYLYMGQQLMKDKAQNTLGEYAELQPEEVSQELEKQTNNLETSRKTGKKMSEIVGNNPGMLKQVFWNR